MSKQVMNIDEVEYTAFGRGERYSAKLGLVSRRIGARDLGYNLTIVPPGKRAFPLHNHRGIEEMFFIFEGEGELRVGQQTTALRKGDFIACPTGGPETAHQIINTSDADLKYLAVSTTRSPDVVEYPESGKVGVADVLSGEGEGGLPRMWRRMFRDADGNIDYWDGED